MLSKTKLLFLLLCEVVLMATANNETYLLGELAKVCPEKEYCREKSTALDVSFPEGFTSCCTVIFKSGSKHTKTDSVQVDIVSRDCSCDEACEYNCCNHTNMKIEESSGEQCIFLTTRKLKAKNEIYFRSYYVVTEPPVTGCVQYAEETNRSFAKANENKINPWDNKVPVFSKKLGKIFHNRSIALCYGVEDASKFKQFYYCDNQHKWDATRFYYFTSGLEHPEEFPDCFYSFVYQGENEDIATRQCYLNLISTCRDISYTVPDYLSMSTDAVNRSCSKGPFVPYTYGTLYKNPFCAICNGLNIKKKRQCSILDHGKTESFTTMISINNDLYYDADEIPKDGGKCYDNGGYMDSCREILCPTGHLRADNGPCVWPFEDFWFPVVFHYDLKFEDSITINELKEAALLNTQSNDISYGWLRTPVPFSISKIAAIFQKESDRMIDFLNVKYEINEREDFEKDLFKLLDYISFTLQQPWEAEIRNRNITLTSSIGRYPGFSSYNVKTTTDAGYETRTAEYLNGFTFNTGNKGLQLIKTFFCEQIELNWDEYTIDRHNTITFHVKDKSAIFFDQEFVLLYPEKARTSARVCLDDLHVQIQDSSATQTSDASCINILAVVCSVSMYVLKT